MNFIGILEYLSDIRRCARVIAVRRITGDYWAPLGTWVIREATRRAMKNPPMICADINEGSAYVSKIAGSDKWLSQSSLLKDLKFQKSLFDF